MLFFDGERRNVHEVGVMRVHCVEVKTGINLNVFESGLDLFLSGNIFLTSNRLLPRLHASSSASMLPRPSTELLIKGFIEQWPCCAGPIIRPRGRDASVGVGCRLRRIPALLF